MSLFLFVVIGKTRREILLVLSADGIRNIEETASMQKARQVGFNPGAPGATVREGRTEKQLAYFLIVPGPFTDIMV